MSDVYVDLKAAVEKEKKVLLAGKELLQAKEAK